jgi:hypothetical protein
VNGQAVVYGNTSEILKVLINGAPTVYASFSSAPGGLFGHMKRGELKFLRYSYCMIW